MRLITAVRDDGTFVSRGGRVVEHKIQIKAGRTYTLHDKTDCPKCGKTHYATQEVDRIYPSLMIQCSCGGNLPLGAKGWFSWRTFVFLNDPDATLNDEKVEKGDLVDA